MCSSTIDNWLSQRPKWQQFAAKILLDKGSITEKEVTELTSHCLKARFTPPDTLFFLAKYKG
ncbi:MAG: hypothetical protein ABIA04_15495 [Pseudomonadota bacterium]